MGIMQEMMKGFQFQVCGQLAEPLRITDERTGEVTRMLRIEGYGKTYSFAVESEEQLESAPPIGTEIRASGLLKRRGGTTFMRPIVQNLVWAGQPNWKPFNEEEWMQGAKFAGWCIVTEKKKSDFRGETYYKLHAGVVGDAVLFQNFASDEFFVTLPEKGPVLLAGHLESKIDKSGKVNAELSAVIESFRTDDAARRTPPEEKKAG